MKGIILAGGAGTRLHPVTLVLSKQLLPVYDKPMVYYPLSTLMLGGIREILIISTPRDLPHYRRLLGDGGLWGLTLSYAEQLVPNGLPQAFVIGAEFLRDSPVCLILGDNVFHGDRLPQFLERGAQLTKGALVFAYPVRDPERYGVIEFDARQRVLSLEEKPTRPKSRYVVPGLYFCDAQARAFARELRPSARGEYEITDLIRRYLERGELAVEVLGEDVAWLDTGTPGALLEAANFISATQQQQGSMIGCPEEVAFRRHFIDKAKLLELAASHGRTEYGAHLRRVAEGEKA